MSLPTYGEYKDSGIAWVGGVPAHWHIRPLLGVADERSVPNVGLQENNLLSLSYGRIVRKDIDSNDGLLPESFETYQIVYEDDIVLRLTDLQNDKRSLRSAQVQERGIITSAYLALQPTGVKSAFLSYLLRAYDLKKVFYSMGGGLRQSMKFADLKRMPVIVPPTTEQVAIATFLDRETAKIDPLIAEQEKLIALLAEKRQATISHAVTKGISTDARMKESGVAWLGEVPAHWEILKGGRLGVLFGSGPVAESDVHESGQIPFIKVGSLSPTEFEIKNWTWYVSGTVASQCAPYRDFIVFPKRGAAIFMNKVNIVDCEALIDPNLMGWKIGERAITKFVAYILKARGLGELADVSTVPQINNKHIEPEMFPVPPLTEQAEIIDFLGQECSKLDLLQSESERAIALLKERRSALIAAAVTGRIDVRGTVLQASVESPEAIAA